MFDIGWVVILKISVNWFNDQYLENSLPVPILFKLFDITAICSVKRKNGQSLSNSLSKAASLIDLLSHVGEKALGLSSVTIMIDEAFSVLRGQEFMQLQKLFYKQAS